MPKPELTDTQLQAVLHPAARLQILACAGSGKTEVLARRAVRFLQEVPDPASVIAFTFTEKAAGELKARIELRAAEADPRFHELPPVGRGMFIGTTHSWALRALQGLGGFYETVDGLTEEQEWVLLHRVARRLGIVDLYADMENRSTQTVAAAQAIDVFLRSMEVVHNERIDRAELRKRTPKFVDVLERYEWLLREMRLLPFRLMIGHAVDELESDGRLRAHLTGRIAHVLVDEFQDFNLAQDWLLGRLAEAGASVTVVADDDQAIYQWRGGDVRLFVSFAERFRGTEVVQLGKNHRCRPEIVAFAQHVVCGLSDRLEKVLESSREAATPGAVEIFHATTPAEEAETIGKRVSELVRLGHKPSDIAVLYRSVRTSARPLVEVLRRMEIPVVVVGRTSLLARPEVALVARIFVNWAGGTWYPNPQFEPEVVTREALIDEIRAVTGMGAKAAERAVSILEELGERVRREGVDDSIRIFNEILYTLGFPGTDEQARLREMGLGRMSELLTEFDHAARRAAPAGLYRDQPVGRADEADEDTALAADRRDKRKSRVLGSSLGQIYLYRLRAFLEEFAGRAAEETPDTAPEARNAVQVMTVHQAKGLEFPIVFVPALVEGRFPSALMGREQHWYVPDHMFDRRRYEGREDDEARLLYVALTRARELLIVSWFREYARRQAAPSRFLTKHLAPAFQDALMLGGAHPAPVAVAAKDELTDMDFSSLVTYTECGYRYWLRYVCGFQPLLVPELGFGKILHHLVSELARRALSGERPAEDVVDSILEDSFYLPFAGPIPANNLREAARRRGKAYVRGHGQELMRVVQPEVRFEVPLGNARLRGRVDLILRVDGGSPKQVELVDFKTSSNRPPSEVHKNQLRMYAVAAEQMGFEPLALAIHDLDADSGGRIPVPEDPRQREAFKGHLEQVVTGIQTGVFGPVEDRKVCRSCDFRRFCRYAPGAARLV